MKRSPLPFVVLLFTAASIPLVCACAAKKPNPPVAVNDSGSQYYTPPEHDSGSTAIAASDMGDGGTPGFTTASASSSLGSPSLSVDGGGGAAVVTSPEGNDPAIDAAVTAAAAKVAPKMDREGQPGRATLKEGEHFAMLVTMAPGRCYTIVGFSPAGNVVQLDLKLLAPPLYNVESSKSAAAEKNQPVIGKGTGAMCPVLPIAVPWKVDAVATKGAGRIGIHVFARNK